MTGLDKNYRMFLDVSVTIELPHEVIICVHIYLDCTTEKAACCKRAKKKNLLVLFIY